MSRPNLVILDGHALNPGDLSWSELQEFGTVTVHPRTSAAELSARADGAEILVVNKVPLDAAALGRLSRLRFIAVTATGYNVVDVGAARQRGVVVSNVPAYGTHSVAQHAFGLILAASQQLIPLAAGVRAGRWAEAKDWCYWDAPLTELRGLTLGIVGAGRIGGEVARLGEAFGMKIRRLGRASSAEERAAFFAECDCISLHCPLTDATRGLVNRETLARMKPTAILVNTSRGALIDEQALADALHQGRLAAALDVLGDEPPRPENPLFTAPRAIVTPHVAWATVAARKRLLAVTVENVRAFLAGRPQNVVS